MMREGSIRRDLDKILPNVLSHKTYLDRLMFCTDGVSPKDIVEYGLIDHCIRKVYLCWHGSNRCHNYWHQRIPLNIME